MISTRLCLIPLVLCIGCGSSDDSSSTDDSGGGDGGTSATTANSGGSGGSGGTGADAGGSSSNSGGSSSDAGGSANEGGTSGSGGSTTSASSGGSGGSGEIITGSWEEVTNNLPDVASDGGDIFILKTQPQTGRIIAGIGHVGLYATDDFGDTWFALGEGTDSEMIPNIPTGILFDPDDATIFWENGIYGGAGVFYTEDNGDTFTRLGDISHNDGLGVDFSDPQRRTLLAGSHETVNTLYLSIDGGESWTNVGDKGPQDVWLSYPLILDSETYLLGACGGPGACGVYRSIDEADSWMQMTEYPPGSSPLLASDGSIYWPLTGTSGIIVSHDDGETWTQADGPVRHRAGTAVELPDGRVVALGSAQLVISADKGATWVPFGDEMPYPGQNCGIYGLTYSPEGKAFLIAHNDCSGDIVNSQVFRMSFDYEGD